MRLYIYRKLKICRKKRFSSSIAQLKHALKKRIRKLLKRQKYVEIEKDIQRENDRDRNIIRPRVANI